MEDTISLGKPQQTPTYTLVVVRCKGNVTWLPQVPSDWRIVVYDKCGTNTTSEFPMLKHHLTSHTAPNIGREECTTYLKYMVDYYDNLTDINVFACEDALRPYCRKEANRAHTPFDTFGAMANATQQFMTPSQPYLAYGVVEEKIEMWGEDRHSGRAKEMNIMWPYFLLPEPNSTGNGAETTILIPASPPPRVVTRQGAHFAVRKELILMRPKEAYLPIAQEIRQGSCRAKCIAMEFTWHILFGQPAVLPQRAIVPDLLNLTRCRFCKSRYSSGGTW